MKVTCFACHGKGKIWCPACNGKQKMRDGSDCIVCKGCGLQNCYHCLGTGKLDKEEADDYRR